MRIKTQLLISIITFSIILVIIGSSVALTQIQITELNNQSVLTNGIQTGASDLNYISNNYFLYQDNSYITLWQTKFSTLSNEIASLNSTNPQQQALINTVSRDMENLNTVFTGVTSFLSNAPRNESIRILPSFQTQWNRMAVQIQALAFDSQQLSQNIQDQTNQAILINTILTVALLSLFGAFFITIYFVAYRRTARSIAKLKNGIAVIGSGNLDYTIEAGKKDEIADISKSVNTMATNLKTVTASKTDLEQAQASLRESEQRWATTLASIGDAVIATDTLGKIVFMNGVAEALTGWKLSEASQKLLKNVFNIINEKTRLQVESPIERVLREGIVVGLANHTVLIRKDGSEIPIDDSGAPIKDRDGKTIGVVLIFRDISERKKAEEAIKQSEQRYSELFNSIPEGFSLVEIVHDDNGRAIDFRFLEINPTYAKLVNKSKEQIIGKTTREAFGPIEDYWYQLYDKVAKTGESVHYDNYVQLLDEYYEVYAWRADIANHVAIVSTNITKRKHMENQLQEYTHNLEKIVEDRTRQLKDSERLSAIGQTAGMVGHDIRNPLQAITSDVYLAKTDLASTPDSEEKKNAIESLDEIEKNVTYINKIVQDLQDFARPLSPHAEEIDLKRIIDDLLEKNGLPKNVKVSVKIETEKVVADSTFINRIMYNLVNNAVQAMPYGGKLTIHAYKQSNDTVIAVKDTGVGIPEAVKNKLFTPMFTTKSKGQGFGLAVIKRMTEALGGTVTFESQEGKGTTFTLRLPSPKS